MNVPPCTLRRATRADATALLQLICALAEFESLEPPDIEAQQRLLEDAFGEQPRIETWLAFVDGRTAAVGYAILLETYSSFLARPTLYLEDVFVLPEFRNRGIGSAFLRHCVALAHERGCGRMEWTCLDWNTRAQRVYEDKLGAQRMLEWYLYRLTRPAMEKYLGGPAER
jgi:GNAT superfamily N-acetyltransferase